MTLDEVNAVRRVFIDVFVEETPYNSVEIICPVIMFMPLSYWQSAIVRVHLVF